MKNKHFLFLALLVIGNFISTAQDANLFEKKELIIAKDTLRYRILYPENFDTEKTYPLVLFLHGAGERGNDNEKQRTHGSSLFVNKNNRT